jgi:hypothetical protein
MHPPVCRFARPAKSVNSDDRSLFSPYEILRYSKIPQGRGQRLADVEGMARCDSDAFQAGSNVPEAEVVVKRIDELDIANRSTYSFTSLATPSFPFAARPIGQLGAKPEPT